jgi:hypothetical protein
MRRRISFILLLISSAFPMAALSQQTGTDLTLSLPECIQKTLKNNLGLAADLLTPEMAAAACGPS